MLKAHVIEITKVCVAAFMKARSRNGEGNAGMRGTRGMFTRILENLLQDSGECCYFIIPGNVEEDSGECSKRFRGMFPKIPGMIPKIPGNDRKDSGKCSRRLWGMLKKIPGNARRDSGECSKRFRGIFEEIPGNVPEDSGECWQRFSRMLKKIERFIMQLNENRIKGYILKYDKKCAQKFIKTSHVNESL